MGQITILPETTLNPISLIGQRAGICWGADTSDPAKNYKRGWDCITSGHGRTMEFVSVDMIIEGYSARVIREYMRHVGGGLTVLQASTRYINYDEFGYVMPPSIAAVEDAGEKYQEIMREIGHSINVLTDMGVPREDAAMLLPLGMTTKLVDHKNLRNLVDMSRQRMCNRAYWEFRELFRDISIALTNYGEEWGKIVNTQFMPKCKAVGFCIEKHGCGMMPKKGETEQ